MFQAIAAMSENRVIGNHGKLPWHLPEEYRWFKHKTMGGTLVMGRITYESIGKPLPGRKTIVLTRHPMNIAGVEICPNAQVLLDRFDSKAHSAVDENLWICGGTQIYEQFLPKCRCLYLTRVKQDLKGDAFFPAFENDFSLDQVIHENQDFRIERWHRKGSTHYAAPEIWPFPGP